MQISRPITKARASLARVAERFEVPIQTELSPAADFWAAEEYHQDYYLKNPGHYARYRRGCGRDARLQQLWGTQGQR